MLKKMALEMLALPGMDGCLKALDRDTKSQLIYGLNGSARTLLIAAVRLHTDRPVLIVAADTAHAGKIYEDLLSVLGEEEVFLFPGKEMLSYYNILSESADVPQQRVAVLRAAARQRNPVVVTTATGVLSKMSPPARWHDFGLTLRAGAKQERDTLLSRLLTAGYERAAMVEAPGQIAVRGGIVDIFPVGESRPCRIEFFGDTVESLRDFDPRTQRSSNKGPLLQLSPAREVVIGQAERERAIRQLSRELQLAEGRTRQGTASVPAALAKRVGEHLEQLRAGNYFTGIDQYMTYFYPEMSSLFAYFPKETLILVDDPLRCEQVAQQLNRELREAQSTLLVQGELLPGQTDPTWDFQQLLAEAEQPLLAFSQFIQNLHSRPYRQSFSLSSQPAPRFLGQWEMLAHELSHWREQGYRTVILTSTRERSASLAEMLAGHGIAAAQAVKEDGFQPRTVIMLTGNLDEGFVMPALKLAVLTEQDILPQRKKQRRLKGKEGLQIADYQELSVGEYVVHEQHGIGQYLGIRTLEVGGAHRDYLYVQYAGNDKLYLPVEQIDVIRKYIGVEGRNPKLHALGGGEWSRVKARVQASIQELARELLALYAARETVRGHAFLPDQPWQKDFEAVFPYEETPDQLQTTAEVKEDMERSRPMDRLLCGDVGFGKTEVALRAAFKAVMDGKQVAFLVPTTVLAQQHYHNFIERFAGFPVNIAMLSRFSSTTEQKETLRGIAEENIDILVATHRLLSRDVRFHDLGLLIIDEEQRFGVRHKEKIKLLKQNVDVLTMTATPIPRTLHMSLVGVRDMSIIETPPEDRYPIQTYVLEYSDLLVREALLREIARGGQAYFVHNRIGTIEKWAAHLHQLLPEAKIAVAHGQMPEGQLERVMLEFLNGRHDILLSTTIVEAGLDIPNVNTIIINEADKFGLSQLYQLRGRVGRSNRIAYCYLTYQKEKILSEAAEKRLQAIKEFTELGSGLKIALRDLEIRGAGNILGPEQHGFVMAVGFDLYVKLLDEAVRTYQGKQTEVSVLPRVEITVDAFLPANYIADARQKIVFYQKISTVQELEQLREIREELNDRFGPAPPAAENLLLVVELRLLAAECGVSAISEEKTEVIVRFHPARHPEIAKLMIVARKLQGKLTAQAGKQVVLTLRMQGLGGSEKLLSVLGVFNDLKELVKRTAVHL
ncbi:MAG: Transcription-repair-coupling factor [Syntrophomonadaceae bacterium]|nr:Transcription-repair-coupling factor [Bacillota bacterium]